MSTSIMVVGAAGPMLTPDYSQIFLRLPSQGWASPPVLALGTVGLASLVAFVVVELCSSAPLLDLKFFRVRSFTGGTVVAFLGFLAFNGFVFYNALYLQQVRGHSPLHAGLLTLPATLGTLIFAPIAGRLTGRYGSRPSAMVACSLLCLGLLSLSLTGATTPSGVLEVTYLVLGAGVGLLNTPLTIATMAGMPRDRAGVASGTAVTARQIGGAFGVALLGVFVLNGFVSALPSHLRALRLSAAARRSIISRAGREWARAGAAVPASRASHVALNHAVAVSFASGLRLGYLIAAMVVACAGVIGFVTLRRPRLPSVTGPDRARAASRAPVQSV